VHASKHFHRLPPAAASYVVADQLLLRDAKYHLRWMMGSRSQQVTMQKTVRLAEVPASTEIERPCTCTHGRHTLEVAARTSTPGPGRRSQDRSSARALRGTSRSSTRRRLSGPKRRSTSALMWRWRGPSALTVRCRRPGRAGRTAGTISGRPAPPPAARACSAPGPATRSGPRRRRCRSSGRSARICRIHSFFF
jgi:hypothetical protein